MLLLLFLFLLRWPSTAGVAMIPSSGKREFATGMTELCRRSYTNISPSSVCRYCHDPVFVVIFGDQQQCMRESPPSLELVRESVDTCTEIC